MKTIFPVFQRLCKPSVWIGMWGALLGAVGCSSSGDDVSADSYAAVKAASFTFNETNPSLNVVEVLANTDWVVYWTPETTGVTVAPPRGSGNGSFQVTAMPAGTTLDFGVRTASGATVQQFVTVTRAPESEDGEEVSLSVSPREITFDKAGDNTIAVTTHASWTAEGSDPELVFSPVSGTGNGTITIASAPAGKSCTLTVTAGEGAGAKRAEVTVTRAAEISAETVFSLDFGNSSAAKSWANQTDEWKTQTGTGAAGIAYSVYDVQLWTSYGSGGHYPGASGDVYARMFDDPAQDYFIIQQIALPAGQTDFTLTFGTSFRSSDAILSISTDGTHWKPLTYAGASTYNVWEKATVGFTLARAADRLDIRLAPSGTVCQYGLNFDDIVLTTGGGGQLIDFEAAPAEDDYRFPELPGNWAAPTAPSVDAATLAGDYAFFTRWSRSVNSRKVVRNYSYCYDTRRHNPIWVAYPLHPVYREGGNGRTSPDPWMPDPALAEEYQSKIYRADGPSGSDPYQYWSSNTLYNLGLSGYWTRGHLCMSRERGGADSEINRQTFYPTNIAPQPNDAASTFGEVWGCIEALISGTGDRGNDITADDNSTNLNIVADTLFVVAGCHYEHDNWIDYDSSDSNQPTVDPRQKPCVMPTHQFKVLLRTRSGATGKRIAACTADELQSIGFWIETFTQLDASSARTALREIAVPVSRIEQQTGLTLFPDVPASVKEQCNPSDWGF